MCCNHHKPCAYTVLHRDHSWAPTDTLSVAPTPPLQAAAANQTGPCQTSGRAAWVRRATDPDQLPASLAAAADLPDPPVYLRPVNGSCNSYLPGGNGLERLLWTVQYLVANGFYVVVRLTRGALLGGGCYRLIFAPLCTGNLPHGINWETKVY